MGWTEALQILSQREQGIQKTLSKLLNIRLSSVAKGFKPGFSKIYKKFNEN